MRRLFSLVMILIIAASAALTLSSSVVAQASCPESRLSVGGQGRVTPGSSNRIRDVASTDGSLLGQIPAGGVFDILDGPQCVDGLLWWQVSYNGIEGWTVEANSDGYFVEPFDTSAPTATAAPAGDAQACPAGSVAEPRLVVGMQARVVGNTPSRVRSAPSASADQITQLDSNDIFVVIAGPVCADGYNWWQIDLKGTRGWTAEGQGSDYFVEPIAATATPPPTLTPLPTPVPLDSPSHVTWSADGKWLAVATKTEVLLYDTGSLDVPLRALNFSGDAGDIGDILFSPTVPEQLLISKNFNAWLYDVAADQLIGKIPNTLMVIASSVSYSADGHRLAVLTTRGVTIADPETLQVISVIDIPYALYADAMVMSPDGKLVAVSDHSQNINLLIYPTDGSDPSYIRLGSITGMVRALAFSPDSTKLMEGDDLGNLQLFDITSPGSDPIAALLRPRDDHSQTHAVSALAYKPDGSAIVSAESDPQGMIRVFNRRLLPKDFAGEGDGDTRTTDIAFSPDGKYVAYSADNTVRILETDHYTQIAQLVRSH